MLVSEIEKNAESRRQTASAIRSADIGMSSNRGSADVVDGDCPVSAPAQQHLQHEFAAEVGQYEGEETG